jgi:DNA-directed RNA polymerase specialized sigma24 family protein
MRLHYAEDLSIREIAKIMGKTETGIKVVLFRARQKLQQKAIIRGISL